MEWVWVWGCDTEVVEPTVISPDGVCYSVKTTSENLVVQALHVTPLLYHFKDKTLPLIMKQNHSPLSVVLFPPPTGWSGSHMGI